MYCIPDDAIVVIESTNNDNREEKQKINSNQPNCAT